MSADNIVMMDIGSDHNEDIELALLRPNYSPKQPRDRWRSVFLILQACQVLVSGKERYRKGYLAPAAPSLPTSSYNVITTCDRNGESEPETVQVLPPSPQISVNIYSDGNVVGDAGLQRTHMIRIMRTKDLGSLHEFGGVLGVAQALDTDLDNGLRGNEDDLYSRRIGSKTAGIPAPRKGLYRFLIKSCNNHIILLLLLAAILSICVGIQIDGPETGWYEGFIIILATIILVIAPSMRDFRRERSQEQLGKQKMTRKNQMEVDVIRGGNLQKVSVSDIVCGDVLVLKKGELVPADGLHISGDLLVSDDGSLLSISDQNPFLFYGAKVLEGNGRMLVISVGMNTTWGQMMSQVTQDPNQIPLPAQLDKVGVRTQIVGLSISILILVVLFLRFVLGKATGDSGLPEFKEKSAASKQLIDTIMTIVMKPNGKFNILTTSLTILLVGMVEGVPFVVSLAIIYWNNRALSNKAFAQESLACLTMGSVGAICTGKTGGLTLNTVEVDMCWIGEELIREDSVISLDVLQALCNGISTPPLMSRSPSTEDSLLSSWAAMKLGIGLEILKQSCTIVETRGLTSNEEGSGILMRMDGDNERGMCLHWKGPATTILSMCSHYYDREGKIQDMNEQKIMTFGKIIGDMQSKHLETIAFAYKQIDIQALEENNLILVGLLGLKRISWYETIKAMADCRHAGVNIILVAEDDVLQLEAIALRCGILPRSDSLVLEGETFRSCTDEERMDIVDNICVMGNSLPSDKLLLVQCLKRKGHTVAVVGLRTSDAPALKEANVGIAMGTWSSEMARESSDIIMLDGSFNHLVNISRCGRCAFENIRKYLQHELTTTIAGLLITTIGTATMGDTSITAIQLFWINLVVAILGGLALLTEPPNAELMEKPPAIQTGPFITHAMWVNIFTQALYQSTILVTFQSKGQAILGINEKVSKSMIFNSYLLCQVFNQFNARELERQNAFKGVHQHLWVWVAVGATMAVQVAFIEISHLIAGDARLNGMQWAVCFLIGILSWPINWFVKGVLGLRSRPNHIAS